MTVNELIESLKELKDEGYGNTKVMFSYDYGDRTHTTVAFEVENADLQQVQHSDYHNADRVLEGEEGEEGQFVRDVIILSS